MFGCGVNAEGRYEGKTSFDLFWKKRQLEMASKRNTHFIEIDRRREVGVGHVAVRSRSV